MTGEFAIAVHALVCLKHKNGMLSSDSLAENVCTNPARIRKVMAKLKKAQLIGTKEGLDGGYYLLKDSDAISLREIGEAIEADYVSATWKSGNNQMACLISSGMANIMDDIYEDLNEMCKQKLQHITIADIETKIFVDK